jgi:ketosteroid isomerase-like protein
MDLDAIAFSQQWVQAWNAHDVEAVLQRFHDDVVFTSPLAAKLLPESAGVVRGKPALRTYWTVALQRMPDPPIAATVATASGRATRCVGPSDPYRSLRAVVW